MTKALVIDEEPAERRLLHALLSQAGWEVATAADGHRGLELAEAGFPELVLLDWGVRGLPALDILKRLRAELPAAPVIVLARLGEHEPAIEASRAGAADILMRPVVHELLLLATERALERRGLQTEVRELRRRARADGLEEQMGPSAFTRRVIEQVKNIAPTGVPVLLTGEAGTGKELVARAIHRQSQRAEAPFVAVDCAKLPEYFTAFEVLSADRPGSRKQTPFRSLEGGTLFLDRVEQLPWALQTRLATVLEPRRAPSGSSSATASAPATLRVIAAAHGDLHRLSREGSFSSGLYFRLAQYTIGVPPLRERREDIVYLAERLLGELGIELRRPVLHIARDAVQLLQRHAWPGNVRELKAVLRRCVVDCQEPTLRAAVLAKALDASTSGNASAFRPSLREASRAGAHDAERQVLCDALRESAGNKSQAARLLRTDYKTLYSKLKQHGLRSRDFMR